MYMRGSFSNYCFPKLGLMQSQIVDLSWGFSGRCILLLPTPTWLCSNKPLAIWHHCNLIMHTIYLKMLHHIFTGARWDRKLNVGNSLDTLKIYFLCSVQYIVNVWRLNFVAIPTISHCSYLLLCLRSLFELKLFTILCVHLNVFEFSLKHSSPFVIYTNENRRTLETLAR